MKQFFLFTCCIFFSRVLLAQSVNAPLNDDYYHLIDRYEILSGQIYPGIFTNWKAYQREDIAAFADSLATQDTWDRVDEFNIGYLQNDNWEFSSNTDYQSRKPFLKYFYRSKSDLYHVRTKDFDMHLNPVINFGVSAANDTDDVPFTNTRGVEMRGMVDGKVGFYGYIGENQIVFPGYVRDYVDEFLVVPGEGFWKGYRDEGVDFLTARGYVSFNFTKHINFQFGHDRFRLGNGYRSMIFSEFAPAATFMKFDVQVWKLKYVMHISELTADVEGNRNGLTGSTDYPNKWMAMHHLSFNIGKKLNLGVFESIIYGPDVAGESRGFELKYLNPIIFYRAIEQQDGSQDNVILGLDLKWIPVRKLSLYGQFLLDELVIDDLKEGNGWWGNKFGGQLGLEYVNVFGVPHLDLQVEANISRPYNYSHDTPYGNYSQYRQSLAHPRGANFYELLGVLRYQPFPRWNVVIKAMYSDYGLDSDDTNWGGNILLPNTTREMEFGNKIGQGESTQQFFGDLRVTYQWKHNFFIEAHHTYRNVNSTLLSAVRESNVTEFSVRWNFPARLNEF